MNDIQREYNEAIEAADVALAHLYRAQELLLSKFALSSGLRNNF